MNLRITFLLLFLGFSGFIFGQNLRVVVQSVIVDTVNSDGLYVQMKLDSMGRKQGNAKIGFVEKTDTIIFFKGTFSNDLLRDTAWFYDQWGRLSEQTEFLPFDLPGKNGVTADYKRFSIHLRGTRNGKRTEWGGDGKIMREATYLEGKLHGIDRSYGRTTHEIMYENGKRNGTYLEWKDSLIVGEGLYKNDRATGPWKWYEDGNLIHSNSCRNCESDTIRIYFPNQKINHEIYESFGKHVKGFSWDQDGKLVENTNFNFKRMDRTYLAREVEENPFGGGGKAARFSYHPLFEQRLFIDSVKIDNFMQKIGTVELDLLINEKGNVSYEITTPMKHKPEKLLRDLLESRGFETWKPISIDVYKVSAHAKVKITYFSYN